MVVGIDPKVDYAFKYLFGREQNVPLLLLLLNAVLQLPDDKQLVGLELLNPFNDKETLDDKLSILDIKARDRSGRQFNIEMQLLVYGNFRQRVLYYWARLHQGQLRKGMDYIELRPTTTICFVDAPLFPDQEKYHLVFELWEREQAIIWSDQLAIHVLELPKFTRSVTELVTPLDRWLYFLRHAEQLEIDPLPATLDVPEIHRALGELQMLSQSDLERERYEGRLKQQRDMRAFQADINRTLAEIRQAQEEVNRTQEEVNRTQEEANQTLAEARRAWEEHIHLVERLLRRPETPEEQLRGLPITELARLAKSLEGELANRVS